MIRCPDNDRILVQAVLLEGCENFPHSRIHRVDIVIVSCDVLSNLSAINAPIEREVGERLQLRIGVHTGDVVVTRATELGSGDERLAFGMTMNVASRLGDAALALAAPGPD